MAMAVAISPGSLILLILIQNTLAQQCSNNGYRNTGMPQQTFQKTNCASNQIAQNALNFNPQQGSTQQVYQQSNIQATPYQSSQPQINYQQASSQQTTNSISNSPPSKQQNQDLSAIFSALYNIRQPSPSQRSNNGNGNPSQPNYEQQFLSQIQPNPTYVVTAPISKSQTSQPMSNSYPEAVNFQPTVTYQTVSGSSGQPLQNQQVYAIPVHKINDEQSQRYSVPDPPITNQQITENQGIVMIPSSQTSAVQSQPLVLALQPSQVTAVSNQPSSQTNQNQPTIYTVQTQPLSGISQSQQIVETPNQQQAMGNMPMDKQSLMSYVMSQIQAPQGGGGGNPLASIPPGLPQGGGNPLASMLPGLAQGGGNPIASLLPAMMNSKAEKSSSMKTILPLILSLLNDRKGYSCPNCGYNNNQNNELIAAEPVINTGYSNQINYSQQNPVEVFAKMTDQSNKSENYTNKDTTTQEIVKQTEVINNSPENSEENEGFDSEEEYEDE